MWPCPSHHLIIVEDWNLGSHKMPVRLSAAASADVPSTSFHACVPSRQCKTRMRQILRTLWRWDQCQWMLATGEEISALSSRPQRISVWPRLYQPCRVNKWIDDPFPNEECCLATPHIMWPLASLGPSPLPAFFFDVACEKILTCNIESWEWSGD